MKKWIALAIICIATFVGWVLARPSVPSQTAVRLVPTTPLTSKPRATALSPATLQPTVSQKPRETPSLLEELPKRDLIRKEVARDPHAPPPSGAAFAIQLADRIDQAIETEDASSLLLEELDACAANREPGTVVASIQALCLQAARTLAEAHPRLSREVELIFDRAEPETAALTRALEN